MEMYVQGLLDNLPMPGGLPPLTAWITPPALEQADGPRAYVWGGSVSVSRQTAPRGAGFRKWPWTIDIYVAYMTTPDDGLATEPMAGIIDTVMTALGTTAMPLFVSAAGVPVGAAATSATDTQVLAIGENMKLQYPPEKMTAPMQMIWYTALIHADVLEVVQG